MANLERIVNVVISLQTTAVTQLSFSDMLIMGPTTGFLGRTAIVTELSDLSDMGISSTDPMYLAAEDVFSQIPSIHQIYLGRRAVDFATLTPPTTVSVGQVFTVTLGWIASGVPLSATASFTATTTTGTAVVAGLITAIGAATPTPPFTVTNASGALKITPTSAGSAFTVKFTGPLTQANTVLASETMATALSAMKAETNVWYGIISTSRVQADILAVAAWAEANLKLYATAIDEVGALDPANTTHTGALLKVGNYYRTAWWYHAGAAMDFVDAAVMSKKFTRPPGDETWANVKLGGVTTDRLTETASAAVVASNGNTFEPYRNIAMTYNGKVSGGEWIDIIRFRDWLVEQIKINVFGLFIDNRIPYTDVGIRQIKSAIQNALDLGVRRGGIAPEELDENGKTVRSYIINVPLSAQVPFNDKANRVLNDVTFSARLTGAIHAVNISGILTYSQV